ncbi:MAG: type III secretion system chaperone [Achromobacter pulmonis]|uniref:type III secretion system chaperone n=1 Tax=Achromobacter TaxID=222 RepID=UPI00146534A2|nr:type III secretion system chaperone [Achromobacter pulmonis]CAB3662194.1 hypothetical protein LMG26696_03431 [Achromobacter pulmonis]
MSRYQTLLADYARLAGLAPAEDFLASQELVIADLVIGLTVEGDADRGDIAFFTSLGRPAPQVAREPLLQLMLEANALWVGTGGCTLGLQAGTGAVLLCARAPLALCDAPALAAALDAFADVGLLWREVVQGRVTPELPQRAA